MIETDLAISQYVIENKLTYCPQFFDMRRVAAVGEFRFLILTTVCFVLFQDCSYLRLHRLWWVCICSWPTWNRAYLSQEAEVEERGIRDDLIVSSMDPQYRRFVAGVGEIGLVHIPG